MTSPLLTRAVLLATTVSLAVTSLPATVAAQDYPPNQQGSDQGPPPGYQGPPPDNNQGPPPNYNQGPGYDQGPPPGYDQQPPGYGQQPPPPPGYDGSAPPPPPPGYQGGLTQQQQAQDERYAVYAQQWAQANCVRSHGNVGAGIAVGSIFGALIGAGLGGRYDRGGGAIAGAVAGGALGGAVAASSNGTETSPGCPPGYVLRGGAEPFGYYDTAYAYAAPGWYRPWVFYNGAWMFRPYPYHAYYYGHFYRGGGGYHRHYHY